MKKVSWLGGKPTEEEGLAIFLFFLENMGLIDRYKVLLSFESLEVFIISLGKF